MPAGTIALTNNSTTVTGTGTSFTTELKVNDFVVAVVGGVAYTLGVSAIASNTSLTLIQKYDGPTASGLAWNPVPFGTMTAITAQLAAQVTYAIRGLNLDKANWQQVYTGTGNITVNLPDGSSYTGPAWNGIGTAIANKAEKGANTDITALGNISGSIALKKGGSLSYENPSNSAQQLGFLNYDYTNGTLLLGNSFTPVKIKASSAVQFRTTDAAVSNTVNPAWVSLSAGNIVANAFVQTSGGLMYGGQLTSSLQINGSGARSAIMQYYLNSGVDENILFTLLIGGTSTNFRLNNAGYGVAPAGWITSSDSRIKDKKTVIDDPWTKMRGMRGYTWTRLDTGAEGVGFLAQEVQSIFPDNVMNLGETTLKDGTVVKDTLAPDTLGVAAGLHHEAILALMDKFEALESAVQSRDAALEEIQKRLKALDGLDA
ncbi:tail fiber domain-containing protein [Pantoea agglomerans]